MNFQQNPQKAANPKKPSLVFDPRATIELRCGGLRPRTTGGNYFLHRKKKQPTTTTTKGDISNELTMGTFLMNVDTGRNGILTPIPVQTIISITTEGSW